MASSPPPSQHHAVRPESHGSRTLTIENTESSETPVTDLPAGVVGRLHLQGHRVLPSGRARHSQQRRAHVEWSADTVDNEGMGKKKSKICCIFHKQRAFDESSSESSESDTDISSSDDYDSEDESDDDGAARPSRSLGHASAHCHDACHSRHGSIKNAYERA